MRRRIRLFENIYSDQVKNVTLVNGLFGFRWFAKPVFERAYKCDAWLLAWGHKDGEQEPCAIVELDDGRVECVPIREIQFKG